MAKQKKYEHIDFSPTSAMREEAKRGLELRKKNKGKGGLSTQQAKQEGVGSGVARARDIIHAKELSPSTVRRMHAFFSRHAKNKKRDKNEPPEKDKGYVAWKIWGGDSGAAWARKRVEQMNAADKKKAFLMSVITKLANVADELGAFEIAQAFDSMAESDGFSVVEAQAKMAELQTIANVKQKTQLSKLAELLANHKSA